MHSNPEPYTSICNRFLSQLGQLFFSDFLSTPKPVYAVLLWCEARSNSQYMRCYCDAELYPTRSICVATVIWPRPPKSSGFEWASPLSSYGPRARPPGPTCCQYVEMWQNGSWFVVTSHNISIRSVRFVVGSAEIDVFVFLEIVLFACFVWVKKIVHVRRTLLHLGRSLV